MRQVEISSKSKMRELLEPIERRVKAFEWTWTKAVTFSVAITFFLVLTTAVMPSFWLYTADNRLKWNGAGQQKLLFITVQGFWLKELRDAIAMGIASGPLITVLVLTPVMQNWRRKLRGAQSDARPTGGYR
jgi:hypothetical protein